MSSFFATTTLLLAICFASLIAYMINYQFTNLEVAFYIIASSIILAGFGTIPLNHFVFKEPLYTGPIMTFNIGALIGGAGFIFKLFNRLEDKKEATTSQRNDIAQFKDSADEEWIGLWDEDDG